MKQVSAIRVSSIYEIRGYVSGGDPRTQECIFNIQECKNAGGVVFLGSLVFLGFQSILLQEPRNVIQEPRNVIQEPRNVIQECKNADGVAFLGSLVSWGFRSPLSKNPQECDPGMQECRWGCIPGILSFPGGSAHPSPRTHRNVIQECKNANRVAFLGALVFLGF